MKNGTLLYYCLRHKEECMETLKLIFAAFAVLAALDKLTGNHFQIGHEFEKGILAAGTLVTLRYLGVIGPRISKKAFIKEAGEININ